MDPKYAAWFERLLTEHEPGPQRAAARANAFFAARRSLEMSGGDLFGLEADAALCKSILDRYGERVEELTARWTAYLTEHRRGA
jgi:hypothetical protein